MKLTTKGRYGLKAMYYLTESFLNNEEQMSITELSKKTDVSGAYLEKVMALLKKHKLVESLRGVKGGYKLADNPKKISVGDILRALENEMLFTDCAVGICAKDCPNKVVFSTLYEKMSETLNDFKLIDMINKER